MTRLTFGIIFLIFFLTTYVLGEENMKITSPAFVHNHKIPMKYSCQGEDINPELKIEDIPKAARSLALIVDDPDAPMQTWVHWVVFNIPVSGEQFIIKEDSTPGIQGMNDFRRASYGGPCPPGGQHRYFFKVYALDAMLTLKEGSTKKQLEDTMSGHVIDQTELIGFYRKY